MNYIIFIIYYFIIWYFVIVCYILIQESQDRLEEQTIEALESLSKGNKALLEQQKHLKDAQASAYNLVTTNLRELNNEKALIRSGHAQLATMANDIRKKLGN